MPSARPTGTGLDPKAIEILFRKYWAATGWTRGTVTQAEYEYAKDAGVMFDPIDVTHDALVERAIAARRNLAPARVAEAFLASLSSRRLDWRSALGSLSAILHLPDHAFIPLPHAPGCAMCGQVPNAMAADVSVLNFQRLKWGGVWHSRPLFAALDLEWFTALHVPQPSEIDLQILSTALDRFRSLPSGARPGHLEKALRGLLPSNTSERRTLIDILGLAGVLVPRNRPTFWGEYPPTMDREGPPRTSDWSYPVLWWTGIDGINQDAVAFWFPRLA
jgi:hypothetical protein